MWTLIKLTFGALVFGAVAFAAYSVPLAGKTFAKHASEIWGSDVVQEKVGLVREGVSEKIEAKLDEVKLDELKLGPGKLRKLKDAAAKHVRREEELTEADRQALKELLEKH